MNDTSERNAQLVAESMHQVVAEIVSKDIPVEDAIKGIVLYLVEYGERIGEDDRAALRLALKSSAAYLKSGTESGPKSH